MRVLLVEDDEAVSAGISMLLRMDGSAVETVNRGDEAVRAIEHFAPNVVLLDIGLPDISGVEVYRRISDRWPALPVILSSGHADVEELARTVSVPNVTFLCKPYDFADLRFELARLLP